MSDFEDYKTRVSPVISHSLQELSIFEMDRVDTHKYVSWPVGHTLSINLSVSFYSGVLGGAIVDKDSDSKSDDENATKEKSRAAGPVELVGPSL